MDKKHLIQNAHNQVDNLVQMWECCGITKVEAAQILTLNASVLLTKLIKDTEEADKETTKEELDSYLSFEFEKELAEALDTAYYCETVDDFIDMNTDESMGKHFYYRWMLHKDKFPKYTTTTKR